ncbi:hypothetical protein [Haliea sp. E17]|uniref:hypothetical protein n=1 Tax=Haliea sp. E17 TaxID=3401576 RepID=UPI003AB0379B
MIDKIQVCNQRHPWRLNGGAAAVFTLLLAALPCQFAAAEDDSGFSMKVQDAFAITGRGTIMVGIVESGAISAGETVCVPLVDSAPQPFTVAAIERYRKIIERAEAGQNVGLLLAEELPSKRVAKGGNADSDC